MQKEIQEKLKKQLEEQKEKLTRQLRGIAKKDPKIKGNWLARFPFLKARQNKKEDEGAAERAEYENILSTEHTLEKQLKDVDDALTRMEENKYGKCEKCNSTIIEKRLKAIPEARFCLKCGKNIR